MCLYPKLIHNRKYQPNQKNKGNVPTPTDVRALFVPIGCGKCMECKKQKANNWRVRLHEEIRNDKGNKWFVTLSFSDESLEKLSEGISLQGYDLDNKIATIAVRRFLERFRKETGKSVKHWLITELGDQYTERLHIHGIIFGSNPEQIDRNWQYGNTWFGTYVNERTINYIVKYVHKTDTKHKYYNPVILTSKGIGSNYLNRIDSKNNKFNNEKTDETYTTRNGIKLALPSYYRNKLYNDSQREKLWMSLLDKEKRYVNGLEIDISKGDDDYYKVLKQARIINKRLGYGDDEINWKKKKYEQDRRNLKRIERINKLKNEDSNADL